MRVFRVWEVVTWGDDGCDMSVSMFRGWFEKEVVIKDVISKIVFREGFFTEFSNEFMNGYVDVIIHACVDDRECLKTK